MELSVKDNETMSHLISVPDQLAPQLRSLRKARGLTQASLAVKLGVSQSRIAAIERNTAAVSVGQLMALLKVLGVDLLLSDAQSKPDAAAAIANPNLSPIAPQGEW